MKLFIFKNVIRMYILLLNKYTVYCKKRHVHDPVNIGRIARVLIISART